MSDGAQGRPAIPANALALLRKAASDAALTARMEKTARGVLGKLFTRSRPGHYEPMASGYKFIPKPPAPRPAPAPAAPPMAAAPPPPRPQAIVPPPNPRQFSPGRAAATIGGGGLGGAFTYGHMQNQAQNSPDMHWYNPMTWGDRPSATDIYKRNAGDFNQAAHGIRAEMDQAKAEGNTEKWKELNAKFLAGDFKEKSDWNPLTWRMGGLNPFAPRLGSTYQGRMLDQQKTMQGKYDAEMGKSGPQPGDAELLKSLETQMQSPDILPQHAHAMQAQMEMLRKRLGDQSGVEGPGARAIREQMTSSGMRHIPVKPPTSPFTAGGTWDLGSRPHNPSSGFARSPYDFKRLDPWEGIMKDRDSPVAFGS